MNYHVGPKSEFKIRFVRIKNAVDVVDVLRIVKEYYFCDFPSLLNVIVQVEKYIHPLHPPRSRVRYMGRKI